jgi:hypothetical protein
LGQPGFVIAAPGGVEHEGNAHGGDDIELKVVEDIQEMIHDFTSG